MDDQAQALDEAMRAQGVEPYEKVQVDYFGAGGTTDIMLPDGVSFVTVKVMNEGDRRKYQNGINRDVRVQKATGDAIMKLSPADERHALLKATIVGWNLASGGQPVKFTDRERDRFLDTAPTEIIDLIEKGAREANPWLLSGLTVEDIDAEIAALQEMREKVLAEQEGKAA